MAKIFTQNVAEIIRNPGLVHEVLHFLKRVHGGEPGEITLSDRRRQGRIVVFEGEFDEDSDVMGLRSIVQHADPRLQASTVRNRNYGKFRTAHTPVEYRSFQRR